MNQNCERVFLLSRETWRKTAVSFESETRFAHPCSDVTLDPVWPGNGRTGTARCVRDGCNVFRIYPVCRKKEKWHCRPGCSGKGRLSRYGQAEAMTCTTYCGLRKTCRGGSVVTRHRNRYSTYDDGAPFFIPAAPAEGREKEMSDPGIVAA